MRSVHGLQYFTTNGTINHLIKLVSTDDGMGGLATDRIITLLGNICRQGEDQATLLLKYPVIEAIAKSFENPQFEMVIITALGGIGRSRLGLAALSSNKALIENIAQTLNNPTTEDKVHTLAFFTEIFENRVSKTPEEIKQMNYLYNSISTEEPTSNLLMDYLKKPFFELRKASYGLIFSVCQYDWGATAIFNTPGLFELLLNRQVEIEPEGFSWKFSIFQRLVHLQDSKDILGLQRYYDALQYLKNGIIYIPTESLPVLKDEVF